MRETAVLILALFLSLASATQATPLRSSGVLSWWDIALGFFGLNKGLPTIPIPEDENEPTPPKPSDDGLKDMLGTPPGAVDAEITPPKPGGNG